MSKYRKCPVCGEPGNSRERKMGGNDRCANGHIYLSQAPESFHPDQKDEPIRKDEEKVEWGFTIGDRMGEEARWEHMTFDTEKEFMKFVKSLWENQTGKFYESGMEPTVRSGEHK